MPVSADTVPVKKAKSFPLYRTVAGFVRDPLLQLQRINEAADGELARLGLGASRPYLATHPDHVQQILRRESENFLRDGVFWRPLNRLMGTSILAEGDDWELSKRVLQPVFTTRNVNRLTDLMATAINDAVEKLRGQERAGRTVNGLPEMSRIVNETVIKVLFGDKISPVEADRMIPAFDQVARSIAYRFLLPFVPRVIPLPGDRSFRAGVKIMDETLFELVDRYRDDPGDGGDIFTVLCEARRAPGSGLTDTWVRDNLLAMFATSTETTTLALTWLWPLLNDHPDVSARLHEEIDRVVGSERVRAEHLHELPYVKQVVQELLRLYPVGWLFPRMATKPTTIGGVSIKPGETVLISPFLTHRLASVWERPLEFDPDRFAPENARTLHRYAYFPFGGGPHQCIGRHVFNVEAQMILTSILSRFRPTITHPIPAMPRIGATLRPREDIKLTLTPKAANEPPKPKEPQEPRKSQGSVAARTLSVNHEMP
ncbi:cytochrome P450 [Actinomadura rudentiformis]|uniref:Cytochrome P450 n=1 Tax=Actinomadura rudentiformis TaxID=359158 RepID=A0A6H9YRG8_9ACTN|nr:cytochrome P450 [Actinomadura rudentiformis]KAB2350712.1 cytochrome P450 [Actinomadura rudentiformis]